MPKSLDELLKEASEQLMDPVARVAMLQVQRMSFAYGNANLSNLQITRAHITYAARNIALDKCKRRNSRRRR